MAIAAPVSAVGEAGGYRLESGAQLDGFQLPTDVRLIRSWPDGVTGLTFDRYQQYAAPLGVLVEGAQLTVVRRGQKPVIVAGEHYPSLRVSSRPVLNEAQAISVAAAHTAALPDVATDGGSAPAILTKRVADLRVDPSTGRLLYLVESSAPGQRLFHRIDAETGAVLAAWSGLDTVEPGMGTGVKGDRKSLTGDGLLGTMAPLTRLVSGAWRMRSGEAGPRYETYNAKNSYWYGAGMDLMSDAAKSAWANDNDWQALGERAAVDAQYYAALTDHFYLNQFGFDVVGGCLNGPIRSVVHYLTGYDNAFWDGDYMVYGDGDGVSTRAMSGGQDVVTHELSHAVTECRAPLDYVDESGALNEAFSDIMAIAAEWDFQEPLTSACRLDGGQSQCADWWLGEDVVTNGAPFAFRNLAQPALVDQPSHWADRYKGRGDGGGVHINSGIANHAFYLMVHGGRNSRCLGPSDPQADCDVVVPAIGMAHAEQIMYAAWLMLTTNAKFCAARDATLAAARVLPTGTVADVAAAELAWRAVGVGPCSTPSFDVQPSTHSVPVAPGTSGQLFVQLQRSLGQEGPIDFAATDAAPTTIGFAPAQSATSADGGTTVTFTVPADAAPGIYPITLSATDPAGPVTAEASISLLVDADAPAARIDKVRINPAGSVLTDGSVPLNVVWSATDATSGVVSGNAQYSANGLDWFAFASGVNGSAPFSALDGAHQFRAGATDAVGNSSTSDAVTVTQTSYQENSAIYRRGWSTSTASTPWGSTRFSKTRGATAKFIFSGTDIAWIASRGPKRGKAKVYLDGVLTKVDLYAGSLTLRRVVFSAAGLVAGPHTLKIVVSGTSGRPRVDVDGFVVLAQ